MDNDMINKGWERMKVDLDRHLPTDKRRKKGLLWWSLGSAAVVATILFLISPWTESQPKPISDLINNPAVVQSTESGQNSETSNISLDPKSSSATYSPTQDQQDQLNSVSKSNYSHSTNTTSFTTSKHKEHSQAHITQNSTSSNTENPSQIILASVQPNQPNLHPALPQSISKQDINNYPVLGIAPTLPRLYMIPALKGRDYITINTPITPYNEELNPKEPSYNYVNEVILQANSSTQKNNYSLQLGYNRRVPLKYGLSLNIGAGVQYRSFSSDELTPSSPLYVEQRDEFEMTDLSESNLLQNTSLNRQTSAYLSLGLGYSLNKKVSFNNSLRVHYVLLPDQFSVFDFGANLGFNEVFELYEEPNYLVTDHNVSFALSPKVSVRAGLQVQWTPTLVLSSSNYQINESRYFASLGLGYAF